MKHILKYTGLGILAGWAVLSMAVTGLMSVQSYMVSSTLPPDLVEALWVGGIIGGIYGLYKAGLRLQWK